MENTNVHTVTVTVNSVEELTFMGADASRYSPKFVMGGKDKYSQLETRFELKFDNVEIAVLFWDKMASIIAKKSASQERDESTYIYNVDETVHSVREAFEKAAQWDEHIAAEMAANPSENPPF